MNGYLDHVIEKVIARKLKAFTSFTSHTVKKWPVYLYLPWLETPSVGLESNVEKCFFGVGQCVIFTSRPLIPVIKKGVLPASL